VDKIGVGVVTVPERKDYLELVVASIQKHLSSHLGGPVIVSEDTDGRGVAWSKNRVLVDMMESGCDWLFVCEDDIIVQSPEAVTGYIGACQASGFDHLNFHAHGPANPASSARIAYCPQVTFWPNMVGAWSVYSRHSIEMAGLMDERFVNAWEHCEHTQRLATLGFTSKWPNNADATGSEMWLAEIPGSIANSSIRCRDDWQANIEEGRKHWVNAYPDTYRRVFAR
jgi:hypothetical protein